MAISLSKGGVISLAKESGPAPLDNVLVGLGWDPADTGAPFDLDASVFLTDSWSRCVTDSDFVFYGNKVHNSGAVTHCGDSMTGVGDGDDEQILIRIVNQSDNRELARFSLSQGATGQDCLIFAELERQEADWTFHAIGDFTPGGLGGALAAHGTHFAAGSIKCLHIRWGCHPFPERIHGSSIESFTLILLVLSRVATGQSHHIPDLVGLIRFDAGTIHLGR